MLIGENKNQEYKALEKDLRASERITDAEGLWIKSNYLKKTDEEMGLLLNRPAKTIKYYRYKHKLTHFGAPLLLHAGIERFDINDSGATADGIVGVLNASIMSERIEQQKWQGKLLEARFHEFYGKYKGKGVIGKQIDDGFGNTWSAQCPKCKNNTMQIVRVGKAQCSKCG